MKLSEYVNKFDKNLGKKMDSFGDNIESKIEELGGKIGSKIEYLGDKITEKVDNTDDYIGARIDCMKKEWKKLKPEVRNDIKKGAIGAGIALVTPWYIAIPAGIYTYKKAKKFLKLKKSYPKE